MISWYIDMQNNISSRDWLWFMVITIVVLALSTIPYIVGFKTQDSESVFSGSVFYVPDYSVHMGAMQLGYRGDWKYQLLFTSEEHQGAFVKLPYVFLGHAARWFGLSPPLTFQLARLIFGFFACLVIYWFISQAFPDSFSRNLSYLLAIMGSGLGWLQWILDWIPRPMIDPIDFWAIDPYIFSGLMNYPHFSAVYILFIGMIVTFISYTTRPSPWKLVWITLGSLVLQLIQPYVPLLAFITMGGIFIVQAVQARKIPWRYFWGLAGVGIVQIPLLLYNLFVFNNYPVYQAFSAQNLTPPPPIIYYFLGFGLFWPFVLVGILKRKVFQNTILAGIVIWLVSALVLTYMPWQIQRRMMFGYSLPIAVIFTFTLREYIAPWFETNAPAWLVRRKISILLLVLPFFMLSSIYTALGRTAYLAQQPGSHFYPSNLVNAIDWLEGNSEWDEVLLSSPETGQLAVARIGKKVFIGHKMETINYQDKLQQVESLFQGALSVTDISPSNVTWILYGPYEKELGKNFSPDISAEIVFQNQDVRIYKVIQ